MMKKISVLLLSATLAMPLVAQGPPPDAGAGMRGQHMRKNRGPQPEKRLQHLTRRLNLTQDQQTRLRPILEEEAKQVRTIRHDDSLTRGQMRAKIQELHQNTFTQIEGVLTPEQQKLHQELREKNLQRRNAPANPPNPQQ
jgi:protein CpxP